MRVNWIVIVHISITIIIVISCNVITLAQCSSFIRIRTFWLSRYSTLRFILATASLFPLNNTHFFISIFLQAVIRLPVTIYLFLLPFFIYVFVFIVVDDVRCLQFIWCAIWFDCEKLKKKMCDILILHGLLRATFISETVFLLMCAWCSFVIIACSLCATDTNGKESVMLDIWFVCWNIWRSVLFI